MKDHRHVDELDVEELEAVLRLRRRQERLKRLGNKPEAVDPLARRPDPAIDGWVDGAGAGDEGAVGLDLATRYSATVQTPSRRQRTVPPIKWRWIRDQFLLVVEILAILGLLWAVGRMFVTVNQINEESRGVQTVPTVTPTPIIGVFVLPGGHPPPDANRASEPAPIPAHLKDLVAQVTPVAVPTRGAEHAQRIIVPAIGVDAPVVEGDDWESLKKGAGHHVGSANPGERGNTVISAHNDIYGEIFRGLPDLSIGDEITVQTPSTSYTYVVEQTRIVAPTDVGVMDATSTPVLTLISCYPYRVNTHRIVAIASLVTD